jgi:arylsulfatase A-like enzyme
MPHPETDISRRKFIQAGTGLAALGLAHRSQAAARRPNILYVFSDMQRASSIGCYGDPNVHTPTLDLFARQGARFDAALSNTPVCCPHRASLQTGLYSHHTGVVSNDVHFTRRARGLADQFREAGYTTGYTGKWHIPRGYGSEASNPLGYPPNALESLIHGGKGVRPHCMMVKAKDAGGREVEKLAYIPTVLTDRTVRFIEEKSKGEAPWVFFLSWLPPHSPYVAPPEYRAHYEGKLELRPNVPAGLPTDYARRVLPDYYGMVESLDAEFKRILDTLDRAGVAGNTIVCYSSDHGDMLGCHGYEAKRWPHEESARVPFLIRYPGVIRPGQVIPNPFSTVDVYPTLAALAGLKPPSAIDGADYSSLVTGKGSNPPRDHAYLGMMYAYVPWPGWRALRTQEFSYARTVRGPWLLHNIVKDPCQMKNLVDDPSSRVLVAEMDRRMAAIMKETGDSWDYKAATGDLDAWVPGGPKQRSQSLGVGWPGAQLDGAPSGRKGRKHKQAQAAAAGE